MDGLWSGTSEISNVRLSIPEIAFGDLVLVDTPGFDDTHKKDVDIIKMVADWLKSTHVFVVNPQHYCLDVISSDMRRIFCSAASSTSIEYPTIEWRAHL